MAQFGTSSELFSFWFSNVLSVLNFSEFPLQRSPSILYFTIFVLYYDRLGWVAVRRTF